MLRLLFGSSVIVLCALVVIGCGAQDGERQGSAARRANFGEIFTEVRRIELEERDTAMISRMPHRAMDVAEDGRIVLADPAQMKIRIYSPEGALLRTAGRMGKAPGEYSNMITGVLFMDDGSLIATDAGNRRITHLRPDLTVDTTFTHPETLVAGTLRHLPDGNLLFHALSASPRPFFDIISPDGQTLLHSFHEDPDYWSVPYWGSAGWQQSAVSNEGIYVANALTFPLYYYSFAGDLQMTFGTPPRSWKQASRPDPGDFGGLSGGSIEEWYRTYTQIGEMHVVADSMLLVSITSLDPDELRYRLTSYSADIYSLDGRKLYEDVMLPGRPIFSSGELYVVLAEPPEGPWTLGVFRTHDGVGTSGHDVLRATHHR